MSTVKIASEEVPEVLLLWFGWSVGWLWGLVVWLQAVL